MFSLLLLCVGLGVAVEGTYTGTMHPQTAYCTADFVAKVTVRSEVTMPTMPTSYKQFNIVLGRVYKGQTWVDKLTNRGLLYFTTPWTTTNPEIGKPYDPTYPELTKSYDPVYPNVGKTYDPTYPELTKSYDPVYPNVGKTYDPTYPELTKSYDPVYPNVGKTYDPTYPELTKSYDPVYPNVGKTYDPTYPEFTKSYDPVYPNVGKTYDPTYPELTKSYDPVYPNVGKTYDPTYPELTKSYDPTTYPEFGRPYTDTYLEVGKSYIMSGKVYEGKFYASQYDILETITDPSVEMMFTKRFQTYDCSCTIDTGLYPGFLTTDKIMCMSPSPCQSYDYCYKENGRCTWKCF